MQKQREGSIHVILGPMFSGKTSDLNARIRAAVLSGLPILCIKHAWDTRTVDMSLNTSHDGVRLGGFVPVANLARLVVGHEVQHVYIDEAQFFEAHDLMAFCLGLKGKGVDVTLAALSSDWNGAPWRSIQALVPAHQDTLTQHKSVCALCQAQAGYTRKLDKESTAQVDVGGDDKYIPTCWSHLTEPEEIDPVLLHKRREALDRLKRLLT